MESVWLSRPQMMRLNQKANPLIDDGTLTPCYVDPQSIVAVTRNALDGESYTAVFVAGFGYAIAVIESPDEIALRRDRALGHERKPAEVK